MSDYAEKIQALRTAQQCVTGANRLGQLGGGLFSLLPWWLSGAPWWAWPVFAVTSGFIVGHICGAIMFRRVSRVLKVFYPELKL